MLVSDISASADESAMRREAAQCTTDCLVTAHRTTDCLPPKLAPALGTALRIYLTTPSITLAPLHILRDTRLMSSQ